MARSGHLGGGPWGLAQALLVCAVLFVFLRSCLCDAGHVTQGDSSAPASRAFVSALAWLIVSLFLIGLLVRAYRVTTCSDPRAGRERRAETRLVRHSVRRPAAEVPLEERTAPPDSDPTLDEEDPR